MKVTVHLPGLGPIMALWREVAAGLRLRTCDPLAPHYGEYIIQRGTSRGLWK